MTEKIFKMIKDNEVKFVDFRFTDLGNGNILAQTVESVDEDLLKNGIMFDGSSISGWKSINESDMILKPDLNTAVLDHFTAQPQLIIFCNVVEPSTGEMYSRCPRSTAFETSEYLKKTGIADTAFFGPEAEFFVFDDVKWNVSMNDTFYQIDSDEGPYNSGNSFDGGNIGHRPSIKGGYFPVPPVDSMTDMRAEMVGTMMEMGLEMEKHHHEVAPSQNELGGKFDELLSCADGLQKYKYVVHMVKPLLWKNCYFYAKPVIEDNGSGMHCHQSLWKGSKPLFAGSEYSGLSETALFYIGGIIKHAKLLMLSPILQQIVIKD